MPDGLKAVRDPATPKEVKDLILGAAEMVLARHLEICTKEDCRQCEDIRIVLDIRAGRGDAPDA